MFRISPIIITILFLLCCLLNAISIGLCLSALFLLIMDYLELGNLLGTSSSSTISPFDLATTANSINDENTNSSLLNSITNNRSVSIDNPEPDSESILPESNSDQLNLIFYLLFYLSVAILGLMGASRRYQTKKMTYLTSHVLLLGTIICFNLLAWFHFRTYSPLSTTSSDDSNLLLESLFDFVDFLVGLFLLISLIINRKHNNHIRIKQRNSITPISESPNGSSQSSYTIS